MLLRHKLLDIPAPGRPSSRTAVWVVAMVTIILTGVHCHQCPIPLFPSARLLTPTYVRDQVSVLIVQGALAGEMDGGYHWVIKWRLCLFLTVSDECISPLCLYPTLSPWTWFTNYACQLLSSFSRELPAWGRYGCCASVALPFFISSLKWDINKYHYCRLPPLAQPTEL